MNLEKLLSNYLKNQELNEEDLTKSNLLEVIFLGIRKMVYELLIKTDFDEFLGYEKYKSNNNSKKNYRNGIRRRKLNTVDGCIPDLVIPRAREKFYPALLEKYKRNEPLLNELITSLYGNNVSTRSIDAIIEKLFDCKYTASSISNITNTVIEEVKAFKERELEKDYYVIYIDSLFTNIRRNTVAKEAVYLVLGVNTEGYRDILGFYIYPQESASVWDDIFKDLKSRGLERVLLFVTDGLTGIEDVIKNNFPKAKIQRCLLHITRNINKKCRVKDREELMKDFKKVYKVSSKEESKTNFEIFKQKWNKIYPDICKNLDATYEYIPTFLEFPEPIRIQIYTTNWIERANKEIRKYLRPKNSLPNIESAEKIIYLAVLKYTNNWSTRKLRGFSLCKEELDKMIENI